MSITCFVMILAIEMYCALSCIDWLSCRIAFNVRSESIDSSQ